MSKNDYKGKCRFRHLPTHQKPNYNQTRKGETTMCCKNDFSILGMAIPNISTEKKFNLTVEEACAYFNIGENTMRNLIRSNPTANYLLSIGNRTLIKKTAFEDFILHCSSL